MDTRPHAFVVMPFGTKTDAAGQEIQFNEVHKRLIRPALEKAGLKAFRADEEQRAGDIRADMFQELLLADLVLADISIDNPNVWYELGVRHALRSRGVVLISGGRTPKAFDIYTDRKLRYNLANGVPDPAHLKDDLNALVAMLTSTMQSWRGRTVSPVYTLLPNLEEPQWKKLRVGGVCEYWDSFDNWRRRLEQARRLNLLGDMLVLADEAPVAALRGEGLLAAGRALRKADRFAMAFDALERGRPIVASDPELRAELLREQGICLERLATAPRDDARLVRLYTLDRVRDHYRQLLADLPRDPKIAETHGLAARVEKQAWVASWRSETAAERRRQRAIEENALLQLAIDGYLRGFEADPGNYYDGINALTLLNLQVHLGLRPEHDPQLATLAGAVRFSAGAGCRRPSEDPFFAFATLADLEVLTGTAASATDAYRAACARHDSNRFALSSCREQLMLLADLDFRSEVVTPALATLNQVIHRLEPSPDGSNDSWVPNQVLLFSGHRIDEPDRRVPRFPAAHEADAADRIASVLDRLGVGQETIAFCQAAAGGDLLFLEAALERGATCHVLLPFDEPTFLERSVLPSQNGERWRDRYYALKDRHNRREKGSSRQTPRLEIREMPEALGPTPELGVNPFERCNLWELYSARACGISKLRFITLWDGSSGGDGPGGTAHLLRQVKRCTGRVEWIDTRTLRPQASDGTPAEGDD
ncbi:MAG: tetratricopeptide repeat-containing protein [Cyanobacteriota bacterium]|nr:tetratricopeptide repeat-containing protein [Cyanobacteriota bacterium]